MNQTALQIVNRPAALERVDGDHELLDEIIEVFLDDTPNLMEGLKEAVAQEDITVCHRHAHSLKSAALNVGAELLSNVAAQMEQKAIAGQMEEVKQMYPELVDVFGKVEDILK